MITQLPGCQNKYPPFAIMCNNNHKSQFKPAFFINRSVYCIYCYLYILSHQRSFSKPPHYMSVQDDTSIFWNLTNSGETVYVCSNHISKHYAPNWLINVTKILGFSFLEIQLFHTTFLKVATYLHCQEKLKYRISN